MVLFATLFYWGASEQYKTVLEKFLTLDDDIMTQE